MLLDTDIKIQCTKNYEYWFQFLQVKED